MLRSFLQITVLVGSLFLLAGSSHATPLDVDASGEVRQVRTFGHDLGKGHSLRGWLRTTISQLGSHDWKHFDREWNQRDWFGRGDEGRRHARPESDTRPGKRWGWRGPRVASASTRRTIGASQQAVPEPAALLAFGAGLLILAGARRRR